MESLPSHLPELPMECWELIISFLTDYRRWESLSLVSTQLLLLTNQLRRSLTVCCPHSLPSLLRRFPNLKHFKFQIPLRRCPADLDSVVIKVVDTAKNLESLDLSYQASIPLKCIANMGLEYRCLRKLNCSNLPSLADHHLFMIGFTFPFLDDLNIGYPKQSVGKVITDAGVIFLSSKLRRLKRIDISGNTFLTLASITALCENCPLISELVSCECTFITQIGMGLALRSLACLSSLTVDEIGIPNIDSYLLESFDYAKNLNELIISDSTISDDMLHIIANAQLPLRKLGISRCGNSFSFAGVFGLLNAYQDLEYLKLQGAEFLTDACIDELSKFLTKLVGVNLSLCHMLSGFSLFTLMKTCKFMSNITMCHTSVGLETFNSGTYSGISRLQSLDLTDCCFLSDTSLKMISLWFSDLRTLNLRGCISVSENGIRELLKNCRKIQYLDVMGITNISMDYDFPALESLKASVDDEGLRAIANKFYGLLHLDLEYEDRVSIDGLKEIARSCRNLRELNLKGCVNVDPNKILEVVLSRPSLRKLIPPPGFDHKSSLIDFLTRHGCSVKQ